MIINMKIADAIFIEKKSTLVIIFYLSIRILRQSIQINLIILFCCLFNQTQLGARFYSKFSSFSIPMLSDLKVFAETSSFYLKPCFSFSNKLDRP